MLRSHGQMLLNELSKCVYVHGLVFFEISTPISGRRATARPPNEWNAFNSSVVFGWCQQLLSSTGAQPSTMGSLGFFDRWTFPSNWYRRMIAVWYFCKRVMSKKCFRKYGVAAQLGKRSLHNKACRAARARPAMGTPVSARILLDRLRAPGHHRRVWGGNRALNFKSVPNVPNSPVSLAMVSLVCSCAVAPCSWRMGHNLYTRRKTLVPETRREWKRASEACARWTNTRPSAGITWRVHLFFHCKLFHNSPPSA